MSEAFAVSLAGVLIGAWIFGRPPRMLTPHPTCSTVSALTPTKEHAHA